MNNRGIIRISDTFRVMSTGPLYTQIKAFLTQGHDIIRTREYKGQSFTLNHPDFTEPDGTEYMLIVTKDALQRPYLHKLQAITPQGFVAVQTYENPYV